MLHRFLGKSALHSVRRKIVHYVESETVGGVGKVAFLSPLKPSTSRISAPTSNSRATLVRREWFSTSKRPLFAYRNTLPFELSPSELAARRSVVLGAIGVNVAVYFMWNGYTVPYMQDNFVLSVRNIHEGRFWTLITSAFCHKDLSHIFMNMFMLGMVGTEVSKLIGPKRFLGLYLGGAISSSVVHLWYMLYLRRTQGPKVDNIQALGASGAVMAMLAFFGLTWPHKQLYLFGAIPIKAATLVLIAVGMDLFGLWASFSNVGHSAHLGGAAYGTLLALARLRGLV